MSSDDLPDYVRRNRGTWDVPEAQLRLLDGVAGLDAIELGGGAA